LILVTGATGNVGRPLVDLLLAEGHEVRAVTRDPAKAGLPAGAEVVQADPSDPDSLGPALTGVSAVFLNPIALGQGTQRLLELAGEAGVERIVLLSSGAVQDEVSEHHNALADWHKGIEDAVTGSGLPWTIIRPFEFAANSIGAWAQQIKYTGMVRGAYAKSATAVIHEKDVAAVAAKALTSADHVGAVYLLTGPESLTRQDMVATIGQALGRDLAFEEIPREVAKQFILEGTGFSEDVVETMLNLQEHSVGQEAWVSPQLEQVLGRPALPFAQWAADHVADFS
jgi:uncharacterized protein YbjT (DUF2867 family)